MFEEIAERKRKEPGLKVKLTVSFLEIYNEEIKDLLDPQPTVTAKSKNITLRETNSGGIQVDSTKAISFARIDRRTEGPPDCQPKGWALVGWHGDRFRIGHDPGCRVDPVTCSPLVFVNMQRQRPRCAWPNCSLTVGVGCRQSPLLSTIPPPPTASCGVWSLTFPSRAWLSGSGNGTAAVDVRSRVVMRCT